VAPHRATVSICKDFAFDREKQNWGHKNKLKTCCTLRWQNGCQFGTLHCERYSEAAAKLSASQSPLTKSCHTRKKQLSSFFFFLRRRDRLVNVVAKTPILKNPHLLPGGDHRVRSQWPHKAWQHSSSINHKHFLTFSIWPTVKMLLDQVQSWHRETFKAYTQLGLNRIPF